MKIEKAYFAAGCFWGVQYYFSRLNGVVATTVGYMGGYKENPTYAEVKAHTTGHYECICVEYDANVISYTEVVKYFFEIHDFSQEDGQGEDIGDQYRSAVFCSNADEKAQVSAVIEILVAKGYHVATAILPMSKFWKAEDYHQSYYEKNGDSPYCHHHIKIF